MWFIWFTLRVVCVTGFGKFSWFWVLVIGLGLGFWLLVTWCFGGLVVGWDVWVAVYFGLLVGLRLVGALVVVGLRSMTWLLCCVALWFWVGWLVVWQFALVCRVCLGFLDFVVCFVLGVCDLF